MVLVFPEFKDPFHHCTDASFSGLRAALMQTDKSGDKHVITLASRVLTAPEYKYSVTFAFKYLHKMVMAYNVLVSTNYAAITNPFKGKNLHGRLARWFLSL